DDLGVDLGASDLAEPADQSSGVGDGGSLYGVINVITNPFAADGGTIVSSAAASFENSCQLDPIGPCTSIACATTAMHDSGTITIAGGASPQTLGYGAMGYPNLNSAAALWPAGTHLTVSATGADVPAWNLSLVMPASVTITAPDLTGMPTAPRSSDLAFTWQGGSQSISVTLAQGKTVIRCEFPAAGGSGSIPTAVLQQLATGKWSVSANALDRSIQPAGLWTVNAVAANRALSSSGQLYYGTI